MAWKVIQRTRARNIENRSKLKIMHALGKKSLARIAYEVLEETGIEPSRGEHFIASLTRSDGSFVCNEAKICADKLTQVINQNIQNEASTNKNGSKDAFEQVFDPEHSGRVRCVGRGPTPSKYFKRLETQTSSAAEMVEIKSYVKRLEDKVDIMASALQTLILKTQFQGSTKFNDLHQTSSNSSDQEHNHNFGNMIKRQSQEKRKQ
ncbi:unnamed protein product [Arabis nemorensis]|uniref:Uncharacterized protein n=1 Tax=Arabis nemorensis TaxID=586526 RepID=A0A565BRF7_9BRAS|nr:unnamed protein product [Arabis nemorensis]